jgi:hypothetical protein
VQTTPPGGPVVVAFTAGDGLAIVDEAAKPASPMTSRAKRGLSTVPQRRIAHNAFRPTPFCLVPLSESNLLTRSRPSMREPRSLYGNGAAYLLEEAAGRMTYGRAHFGRGSQLDSFILSG